MNQHEAKKLIAVIATAWRTFRLDDAEAQSAIWAGILPEIAYAEAELAVFELARKGDEWPPTPGQVLRHILAARARRPATDEAWREAIREAGRVGQGRMRTFRNGEWHDPPAPEWSCPEVALAVETVGFREICLADEKGRAVLRSQFGKAYEAILERRMERLTRESLGVAAVTERAG